MTAHPTPPSIQQTHVEWMAGMSVGEAPWTLHLLSSL